MSAPPSPVLIVEDDPIIARALRRELALHSITSHWVETAAEARALDKTFRVAIVDINLPDGNGLDLYEELKDSALFHKVLFFSATNDEAEKARARLLGLLVTKSAGVGAAVEAALRLNTLRPPRSYTRPASSPDLKSGDICRTGSNTD